MAVAERDWMEAMLRGLMADCWAAGCLRTVELRRGLGLAELWRGLRRSWVSQQRRGCWSEGELEEEGRQSYWREGGASHLLLWKW